MERQDKIDKIQDIASESELHDLLMDLLPKMGYSDVTLTHERGNLPENGKDIVASKFDAEENKKEWYAFVVKKGDVRGTSQGVQEIKAQIADCFTYAWNSIVKGSNIKMSKVKVVVNGKYNGGAKEKILDDTAFSNPNISFWGGVELVDFIDKNYPRYWLRGSKTYKHYVEIFQAKNKEDSIIKAVGIKNEKIQKIIDNAIQPKLIELSINDEGEIRRKWFEPHSVAKLSECALIVGESGSGKSTFFKQLANDIIYENSLRNEYEYYPFILRFIDFKECNFDFVTLLERYLSSDDLKEAKLNVSEIIEKKNFVLFIDALDEIGSPELKEKALEAVQKFRENNPEIKIYCSSRPSDTLITSCQRLKFKYLEITNLTLQQTEQFLNRYFNEEQIKCKRLVKSLKDSHILDKLPNTPLTIALIAAIFDENELEIPATISDLYKHFVDLLLNRSFKESALDLLKIGIHRSVLSYLAETLHVSRRKQIPKTELIQLITLFANERGHKYDPSELIDDLVSDIGLLIENERNEIEFKHLSFQEYFTAYQFYNHNINGKNSFIENFNDIWWQNVAIFYAGMTKDSPELMHEILEKSKPQNFNEYVVNLSGIGFLMQALYNTPIPARIEGIKRNIENAVNATHFILHTEKPEFDVIKGLFHTKYGVFKLLSYWFEFHHTSITLKAPLLEVYESLKCLLKEPDNEGLQSAERKAVLEYSAYLIASTLTEINDNDLNYLEGLLDITNSKNYIVRGLIGSSYDKLSKGLTKDNKRRKEVKKFQKKIELIDHDKIKNAVNVRLLDGKVLKGNTTKNSNITKKKKRRKR
jgi:hypothetical protein